MFVLCLSCVGVGIGVDLGIGLGLGAGLGLWAWLWHCLCLFVFVSLSHSFVFSFTVVFWLFNLGICIAFCPFLFPVLSLVIWFVFLFEVFCLFVFLSSYLGLTDRQTTSMTRMRMLTTTMSESS